MCVSSGDIGQNPVQPWLCRIIYYYGVSAPVFYCLYLCAPDSAALTLVTYKPDQKMSVRSFSWYFTYLSFPELYHIASTFIPPATF